MNSLARMGVGLTCAVLASGLAPADEPAKAEFRTSKLDTLSKDGQFDWGQAEFLDALEGGDGWEVLLASGSAALFRKTKDGPKWEYKAAKIKNSPLATFGTKDTDAYGLILDRMASDGYAPCAVNALGEYTLFKRAKAVKPAKAEFRTILWADVIKSQNAPAERFKEKEFAEALDKQGGEGWEVCACNVNAAVLRKTAAKWEYKTVKVTNSPLAPGIGREKDDEAEAFRLILEALEDKGWRPCAAAGQEILVKRELKKDKKE
jgi:hypothetical protein